jgi:hypothetical protein
MDVSDFSTIFFACKEWGSDGEMDSMASTEVTINYSGDIEDLRYKGNTTLYDSYIVII